MLSRSWRLLRRTVPSSALALAVMSILGLAAGTASATVALYEHDGFQGRSMAVNGRAANLVALGFNDAASSVVVNAGYWQLCQDVEFRGECIVIGPGRYPSLRAMNFNDRLSSVRPVMAPPGAGGSIELFEHTHRDGRSWRGGNATANLRDAGFNDVASSAVVRGGNWELCTDADYRGRCVVLPPGLHADFVALGLNDLISSVRPTAAAATPGIVAGPLPPGAVVPVPGGARPAGDVQPPEITFAANRTARITYAENNCVVFYGAGGRRLQQVPACDGQQVARADDLMNRFRQEFAMNRPDAGNPWVGAGLMGSGAPGSGASGVEGMRLILETDRQGEAAFANGCQLRYSPFGSRMAQSGPCSAEQLRRADEAMGAYRREQGF